MGKSRGALTLFNFGRLIQTWSLWLILEVRVKPRPLRVIRDERTVCHITGLELPWQPRAGAHPVRGNGRTL